MKLKTNNAYTIDIPKIIDEQARGNLSVLEKDCIPFQIKRVYYLYDVPSGATRGGHAHRDQSEVLIALSGSFDVILNDGKKKEKVMLNKPNKGLLIPTMTWRELKNFSSGAICLVIASDVFKEEDYIRDYEAFKLSISR
jgi:dTDP-4-dehydrorhamnose 3,5-epimerase-like enzyme